jgi:hypothetical protein
MCLLYYDIIYMSVFRHIVGVLNVKTVEMEREKNVGNNDDKLLNDFRSIQHLVFF